jgi:hypothetical protein
VHVRIEVVGCRAVAPQVEAEIKFESRASYLSFHERSTPVNLGLSWDKQGVNQVSIWDQPGVNQGSTRGQPAPPYRGHVEVHNVSHSWHVDATGGHVRAVAAQVEIVAKLAASLSFANFKR